MEPSHGYARMIEQFTRWVNAKYETDIAVAFFSDNACFRLEPHRVFSLDEADFTGLTDALDLRRRPMKIGTKVDLGGPLDCCHRALSSAG